MIMLLPRRNSRPTYLWPIVEIKAVTPWWLHENDKKFLDMLWKNTDQAVSKPTLSGIIWASYELAHTGADQKISSAGCI